MFKTYTAKYYPLVNGVETEYTTTVTAKDKIAAEAAIRRTLIGQLEKMKYIIQTFDTCVIGYDMDDLPRDIEYARSKMRVVIL